MCCLERGRNDTWYAHVGSFVHPLAVAIIATVDRYIVARACDSRLLKIDLHASRKIPRILTKHLATKCLRISRRLQCEHELSQSRHDI